MLIKYRIIESKIKIEDISYVTYGIACCIGSEITETIFDISLNRNDVETICNILNKSNIPPVHFRDIVEDYTE